MCKTKMDHAHKMLDVCITCAMSFMREVPTDRRCLECQTLQDMVEDADLHSDETLTPSPSLPFINIIDEADLREATDATSSRSVVSENGEQSNILTFSDVPVSTLHPKSTNIIIHPTPAHHPAQGTVIHQAYEEGLLFGSLKVDIEVTVKLSQVMEMENAPLVTDLPSAIQDMYLHLNVPNLTPANIFTFPKTDGQWAQGLKPSWSIVGNGSGTMAETEFAYMPIPEMELGRNANCTNQS